LNFYYEKNGDICNTKHFQSSIVYNLFFNFLVFLTSFVLFYLSIVVKEILKKFCVLFLYGFEILSKNSAKLWFFLQKIEIFEIQNFNKIPFFTISFLFLAFLSSFIRISPIQTCQKLMEFFVVFYWKD